jgi:hydroxymethylglutaryl-CoA reductase
VQEPMTASNFNEVPSLVTTSIEDGHVPLQVKVAANLESKAYK